MAIERSSIKQMVQVTWTNGANPQVSEAEFYLGGLLFRYFCQAIVGDAVHSHAMNVEIIDDAVGDFDDHWSITVEYRRTPSPDTIFTFTATRRFCHVFKFNADLPTQTDEWVLIDFDVYTFRKNFEDEEQAAKCGNNLRVEFKDNSVVWVNRELLLANSNWFQYHLAKPEKDKSFEFKNLSKECFLAYVYCVHPPTLKLSLPRAGQILAIAKKFLDRKLVSACEEFLRTFTPYGSLQQRNFLIILNHYHMNDIFKCNLRQMKQTDLKQFDGAMIEKISPKNLPLFLERLVGKPTVDNVKIDFGFLLETDEATLRSYDCTIRIDGKKPIYVKKSILGMHSEYFKTLFFGSFSEANKESVTLKDIDFAAFLEYLVSIYTPSPPLTMARIPALLKMADRFRNEVLLKHCSDFLLFKTDKTGAEKLQTLYWADEFNLEQLVTPALKQLDTELIDIDIQVVFRFRPANLRKFIDHCLKRIA